MNVITTEEMKKIEEEYHNLGYSRTLMMENAGRAVADEIERRIDPLKDVKIVILCGTGNNGGDGASAARHLALRGYNVEVFLLGEMDKVRTEEARTMWKALSLMNIRVLEVLREEDLMEYEEEIENADVVVEAMLGTGVKGEVREPVATAIDIVNRSKGLVVAVDLPSGLNPDTGEIVSKVVRADLTVTFHAAKPGLLNNKDVVGELVVKEIGIPVKS